MTAALAFLLLLASPACRKAVPTAIDLEDAAISPGGGIDLEARLLDNPEEIEHLFKAFLPDHGIVPVLVAARNNGEVPIKFHSANSLGLGGGFDGFALLIGGREVLPIHPAEVAARVRMLSQPADYRKSEKKDFVTGTVIAPLGAYYLYKEIRSRREYKPLIRVSLYPARFEGMFDPLILEPGGERTGYLYFPVGDDASPYLSREVVKGDPGSREKVLVREFSADYEPKMFLVAKPCLDESRQPSVISRGDNAGDQSPILIPRTRKVPSPPELELTGPATGMEDPAGGKALFFTIRGEKGDRALLSGCIPFSGGTPLGDAARVAGFSGGSAEMACAEISGDTAVCAVDFKRRSRIFLMERKGDGFSLLSSEDLPRGAVSVVIGDKGYFSLTSDDFCRFTPYGREGFTRYARLGNGVTDIAGLGGGRILALSRTEAAVLDVGEEDMFRILKRNERRRGRSSVIGYCDGALTIVTGGEGDAGDTLLFFDPERLEEICREPLTGKIVISAPHGGGALVLLEEGTLLDIRFLKPDSSYIREGACLPADIMAIAPGPGGFAAVTAGGMVISGKISDFAPRAFGSSGGVPFSVPVKSAGGNGSAGAEERPDPDGKGGGGGR